MVYQLHKLSPSREHGRGFTRGTFWWKRDIEGPTHARAVCKGWVPGPEKELERVAKEELEVGEARGEEGWRRVLGPTVLKSASPPLSPVPGRLGPRGLVPFFSPEHLGLHQT